MLWSTGKPRRAKKKPKKRNTPRSKKTHRQMQKKPFSPTATPGGPVIKSVSGSSSRATPKKKHILLISKEKRLAISTQGCWFLKKKSRNRKVFQESLNNALRFTAVVSHHSPKISIGRTVLLLGQICQFRKNRNGWCWSDGIQTRRHMDRTWTLRQEKCAAQNNNIKNNIKTVWV